MLHCFMGHGGTAVIQNCRSALILLCTGKGLPGSVGGGVMVTIQSDPASFGPVRQDKYTDKSTE